MRKKDKKVDAYIAKSAAFAQPVLNHLRKLIHEAVPECEEVIKWGFPCFGYKGMLCSIAAFKAHCAFGFWKAAIMKDAHKLFLSRDEKSMGHFGRISSLKDLPSDKIIKAYLLEASKLNEEGVKMPARKKVADDEKPELLTPPYLGTALKKNKKAQDVFTKFSYSQKKEYITWLTEAKTEATRDSRLKTAIGWIAEGKIRNWKYLKK
jgi:uncharacterized protein YdeI (YjbR/CyaY-like superfamily)